MLGRLKALLRLFPDLRPAVLPDSATRHRSVPSSTRTARALAALGFSAMALGTSAADGGLPFLSGTSASSFFIHGFEGFCQDGSLDQGEQCDDGNSEEFDGCTSLCRNAVVCDSGAFPGADRFEVDPATGHCYTSYDSDLTTFSQALNACESAGGHLVTVTSEQENLFVQLVRNPSENPWIGAVDDDNDLDAVFDWITGEPFTYTNFAPGEPDDDAGTSGNGECLHITNAAGEWADTNCDLDSLVAGRLCESEP